MCYLGMCSSTSCEVLIVLIVSSSGVNRLSLVPGLMQQWCGVQSNSFKIPPVKEKIRSSPFGHAETKSKVPSTTQRDRRFTESNNQEEQ